jgi:hypothetical protein
MSSISIEIYKRFVRGESVPRLAEVYNMNHERLNWHISVGRERVTEEAYIASRTMRPISSVQREAFAKEGGAHYFVIGDDIYHHYGYPPLRFYCRVSNWEKSTAFKRLMGN